MTQAARTSQDQVAFLRAVPLFLGIGAQSLNRMAQASRVLRLAKGKLLFQQGDAAEAARSQSHFRRTGFQPTPRHAYAIAIGWKPTASHRKPAARVSDTEDESFAVLCDLCGENLR